MSKAVRRRRSTQADRASFAQRLSPLIAAVGITGVPDLLLRYQRRLGLTSNEVVYVQHVLMHHREPGSSTWVAVSDVMAATGAGERSVRDWRAALVDKGYLTLRPCGRSGAKTGGGRLSDIHDLSNLFAALEALALEETTRLAMEESRRSLPEPIYYRGHVSIPQFPQEGRRRLRTQRASPGLVRPEYSAENRRVPNRGSLPEPAESTLPVPADQTEDFKQKTLTPLTPQGARGNDEERDGAVVLKAEDSFQPALPRTAAVVLPASGWDDPAERLLAAFCRGLDSDLASLTSRQRRSDLQLARELHAAGATPAEAEAYAREINADSRRIAPVTLRSFARERQAWLQRRGRSESSLLLKVANGRMPE